jgi:predicted acylesterase/phospholipase RssA
MIDGDMLKAIEWSCAIPFAFPTRDYADGGLIKPIPLGAAIQGAQAGDRMVIVSCHPVKEYIASEPVKSEIDKLTRTLDIMQAALVRASINRFLEINALMKDLGVDEWHHQGKTYRRFSAEIYAPLEPLD